MTDAPEKSAYALGRAARLNMTYEILDELSWGVRTLDAILSSRFKKLEETLTRRDKRDLERNILSIMRHYSRLIWWTKRAKMDPGIRSLIFIDFVINQGGNFQQLQKFCPGGNKKRLAPLSKKEIEALKWLEGKKIDHTDMNDAVRNECPKWAEAGLKEKFGDDFAREMAAMLERPATDLRVNLLNGTRDEIQKKLSKQGFKTVATELSPIGLRQDTPGGPVLPDTQAFKDGDLEPQDEGSQLIALLVGAKPGMQVVDFCAGAGGKSLAIAAAMENKGHLVATDINNKRLQRAKIRFKRAGVVNAQRILLESQRDKWVKKNKGKFDRLLIDAPCSGTGTWRRNPDSKWNKDESDVQELVALQKDILDSAARLLKPGGRMVYATCSLLPAENEQQIQDFLASHEDFKLVPAVTVWEETITGPYQSHATDYLSLSPASHGCDGFFAAVLQKDDSQTNN